MAFLPAHWYNAFSQAKPVCAKRLFLIGWRHQQRQGLCLALGRFEFVPGAIEGLRRLQTAGYALVIITNQSGLARGYYTEDQYQEALTARMRQALLEQGVTLAGIYHCPHHPHGQVEQLSRHRSCRKPAPGLIFQAARKLQLSLYRTPC